MALTKPQKGETEENFVSRFISCDTSKAEFPEEKERLSVAHSTFKQSKKQEKFANKGIISWKESSDSLIVRGYIATTHFDGEDKILKEALHKWKKEINDGNPRSNKVSINHNRTSHVAGVGLKGTARVDSFSDGEQGLFVETLIDKTRTDYDDIQYRVNNGLLDSFSIEYITNEPETYQDNTRILGTDTELHGWTLASQPMNENCVMIKELCGEEQAVPVPQKKDLSEENTMEQETIKEKEIVPEIKEVVVPLSKEDRDLLVAAKTAKKERETHEMVMKALEDPELKERLSKIVPNDGPLQNKEDEDEDSEPSPEETEDKELSKEYVRIVQNKELDIQDKFKRVGLIAEKKELFWSASEDKLGYKTSKPTEKVQFKSFQTNGSKMEFKGLGITTNQNSDTDYLLSGAELRDMFDPIIYDALNQSTTAWSVLRKEDFSQKGNNQVQFVLRTGANATAGFYTGNSVTTAQETLTPMMTKFKKVQVGVSVDGDMIAAARGGPVGDVFGLHVSLSTETLLTTVNSALYGILGAETSSTIIGFQYIAESGTYTTLYNLTRSTTNYLSPAAAGDTYIDASSVLITKKNLRKAISQATTEGANLNDLVFFCHPTQLRLFKGIFDEAQRLMPTSSRFGFEGRCEFDGVPIFDDKDANTDDWFLVDLASHKVAVWVPPTLEMLGKRSDAEEGFVKMYFATYNTCPRRLVQIHSAATS